MTAGQEAWRVRARTAADGSATVYARRHVFQVGAPVHFDPEYPHLTGLEYALGALAAEAASGLRRLARQRGVGLDEVEVALAATLNNPLTALGVVGEPGHPGLEAVEATIYVRTQEAAERVRQLWAEVQARSPLMRTLSQAATLDFSLEIGD